MTDCKLYSLFAWIEDEPVMGNDLRLSNITNPVYCSNEQQQRDFEKYTVGQEVEANCPGFGVNKAVIGKIEGLYCHSAITSFYRIFCFDCVL